MFGNREDFIIPVLARLVGRPVRWHEERAAALLPGAREQVLRWRAAFDADGRLLALDVHARSDHGAVSAGHGWGMGLVGAQTIGTGYALEVCRVVWEVVATNKAPWGGTKPYGKDGATLLAEHVIDRIAETTGVEPAEVRRRNFLRRTPSRTCTDRPRARQRRLRGHARPGARPPATPSRGRRERARAEAAVWVSGWASS